ncbi:hypothetical protein J2T60_002299 [Natronospira proteinivora]|uniref:Phage shock protein B n=1 Tax=Natronospira proteinivora TaxID=1807133 RepID=A0ABT1GAE9_9GAMM|nr:hypothetical protein [Natronospira proteinivora]MCP1728299.1 hypothetical protein [Natronospira proteinivora]
MGPFEMVVAIVVVVTVCGVISEWLKNRRKQLDGGASRQVREELAELRERVEALEAIVTDRRSRLRDEFDRL